MRHLEMLIDGHFVGGVCDYAVGKLVITNPQNGRTVGTAAEGGWDEANAALGAASEAFPAWRSTAPETRAELLRKISEEVRARAEELTELLVAEIGKPRSYAAAEVERLALTFGLAAEEATRLGSEPVDLAYDGRGRDYRAEVRRFPVGVVLAIVPYNWPLNLAAHKIAPALAAGNTLVIKPSSRAPLSTLALVRLLHECGVPPGVANAVVVPSAIAEKMALDPRVQKVSFTGSPAVGWRLKEKLPRKRVTLELGGNAFAIVHEDADLDWAVSRIVPGAYGYAGQICISIQHVLAHAAIYDRLHEKLAAAVRQCPFGDPADPSTICGPLITAEAAQQVHGWMAEAEAAGASVVARSDHQIGPSHEQLVAPTLLEGVPATVRLGCEEVFGPVATLAPYAEFSEALAMVNAGRYGIHAGVFTADEALAQRAFEELEVGGVVVNDGPQIRFDALPYGGVKHSGFGREGVRAAIDEMTEWKSFTRRV